MNPRARPGQGFPARGRSGIRLEGIGCVSDRDPLPLSLVLILKDRKADALDLGQEEAVVFTGHQAPRPSRQKALPSAGLSDPALLDLADRVVLRENPELQSAFVRLRACMMGIAGKFMAESAGTPDGRLPTARRTLSEVRRNAVHQGPP